MWPGGTWGWARVLLGHAAASGGLPVLWSPTATILGPSLVWLGKEKQRLDKPRGLVVAGNRATRASPQSDSPPDTGCPRQLPDSIV